MIILSLAALKKSSRKKETKIHRKTVEMVHEAGDGRRKTEKPKNQDDDIIDFELVFVG